MSDDKATLELYQLYCENRGGLTCIEEFREDVNRIGYVSRLIRKFVNSGETNARLLINHVVILYNVFGNGVTEHMIESISNDLHPTLYALLDYFNRLPPELMQYQDTKIKEYIAEELENA